jgi:hypothetical protein
MRWGFLVVIRVELNGNRKVQIGIKGIKFSQMQLIVVLWSMLKESHCDNITVAVIIEEDTTSSNFPDFHSYKKYFPKIVRG